MRVCIINYKTGNINSLISFFNDLGLECIHSNNKKKILNSDIIVLPGVGTFGFVVDFLKKKKINLLLKKLFFKNKPIIGICLGMQIFFDGSEENGYNKGLGLIPGFFKKNKLSHIGWNNVKSIDNSKDIYSINNKYFYFNHSYSLDFKKNKQFYYKCFYEKQIVSLVKKNNFIGMQFHPEKSQINGIQLFKKIINSFKSC